MGRPKTKEQKLERRKEKEFERALNRDYMKYAQTYYKSPNQKKASKLTKEDFASIFAEWYKDEKASSKTGTIKNIRERKIGERIFETETSRFSEEQFKSLTSSIKRAREEILSRNFDFDADASDIVDFMAQTKNLDENNMRAKYEDFYALLRTLFVHREDFEAWVSPTVEPTDI